MEGKVSWFGGPNDPTDSGHTASGGTTREPGIAVYNHSTLGGYWRVTAANGRSAVLRQTDIGPAPWTGRKIDVTYSALGTLGYKENNFPTNSVFKAEYLGRGVPRGVQQGAQPTQAAQPLQQSRVGGAGPRFERVEEPSLGRALAGIFRPTRQGVEPIPERLREVPGVGGGGAAPSSVPSGGQITGGANTPRQGTELGGFLPKGAQLAYRRLDEGQDVQLSPGQTLIAPGDGEVIAVKSDPTGFGPAYPVVRFTSGPMAGKSVYLGHTDTTLRQGERFRAGQVIARTSKTGHNAPPGWAEIGLGETLGQGNQGQGARIAPYLK